MILILIMLLKEMMNFEKEEQEIETTTINDSSLSGTNNKTDHNVRHRRKE